MFSRFLGYHGFSVIMANMSYWCSDMFKGQRILMEMKRGKKNHYFGDFQA